MDFEISIGGGRYTIQTIGVCQRHCSYHAVCRIWILSHEDILIWTQTLCRASSVYMLFIFLSSLHDVNIIIIVVRGAPDKSNNDVPQTNRQTDGRTDFRSPPHGNFIVRRDYNHCVSNRAAAAIRRWYGKHKLIIVLRSNRDDDDGDE